MERPDFNNLTCGRPHSSDEQVLLAHGSGGQLTADLIARVFVAGYCSDETAGLEDQAVVSLPTDSGGNPHAGDQHELSASPTPRVAFTTDSFVVRPLFFPGGDIGRLAVHGTVNDLAVGGATPLCLSAAFILEEGLPMDDLRQIVASMREACEEAGVRLVTGDTKVVDRGKGDLVFVTTSGMGVMPPGRNLSVRNARPGDRVVVSGTVGDHGIAIMSVREGLEFETVLESDTAPLNGLTREMLAACPSIRWMRDPTRGGLATTLNELADGSRVGVKLEEALVPIRQEVRAACEMLGLDPLYVANEGKLVAVIPPEDVEQLLCVMRSHPLGRRAAVIGEVVEEHPGMVVQKSLIGGERVVTMLTGEQLPRIC